MKARGLFAAIIAVACGMLVLAGMVFGRNSDGTLNPLGQLQSLVVNGTIILAGFAVLMGLINILMVHLKKVRSHQKGSFYSILLILTLVGTFAIGLAARYFSPAESIFTGIFNAVQVPVEASLMAILSVTLVYASIRLLRRRLTAFSIVFLATALLILFSSAPLPFLGSVPILGDVIHPFITRVLATAGARGLLIGVALGTLTTGLRILMGADRPFWGR